MPTAHKRKVTPTREQQQYLDTARIIALCPLKDRPYAHRVAAHCYELELPHGEVRRVLLVLKECADEGRTIPEFLRWCLDQYPVCVGAYIAFDDGERLKTEALRQLDQ